MARIALISCTKRKRPYKCEAKELYMESARFCKVYEFAKLVADKIYILSAKYGLVDENTILEPYDETLKGKGISDRREWSEQVLRGLIDVTDISNDQFIVLAGKDYNEFIVPELSNCWLPLKGKSQGEWIPELNYLISLEQEENLNIALHMLFNSLSRFTWTGLSDIPFKNGIYIMFENGQKLMGMDRIVRVGLRDATSPASTSAAPLKVRRRVIARS